MTSDTKQAVAGGSVVRGRMVSLTVLEIHSKNLEEIGNRLLEKVENAPEFFRNAPLILDLEHLQEEVDSNWLDTVYHFVSRYNFVPVGVSSPSSVLEFDLRKKDIAIWPKDGNGFSRQESSVDVRNGFPGEQVAESGAELEVVEEVAFAEEIEAAEPPEDLGNSESAREESVPGEAVPHAVGPETLVIRQPVRSGQKVYARGGDLIVLSSVNTGAEILADGHIHVYGTLRGRALAGVQGREDARIFCKNLQADLVAIAGFYLTNEDLPAEKRNTAVHIRLQGESLEIEEQ